MLNRPIRADCIPSAALFSSKNHKISTETSFRRTSVFYLFFMPGVLFFLILPDPALGYFQTLTRQDSRISFENTHVLPKTGTYQLGLYVTIKKKVDSLSANWDILPVTSNRIPLDVLDCNPPVVLGLTRQAPRLEVSVQTLLYADLKLKKLLEEYAILQERAHELLNNEQSPPRMQKASLWKPDSESSGSRDHSPLYTMKRLLEAKRRNESRRILMTRAKDNHLEHLQTMVTRSLASLEERARKSSQSLNEMVTEILSYGKSIEVGSLSKNSQSLSSQEKVHFRNKTDQSELPWILKNILNFIHYFFTHKLEAWVYIVCIAILSGVVVTVRKS